MNLLIMSDIHGNLSALQAVLLKTQREYKIDACVLLGDLIDYGMHSNEVIDVLRNLPYPILCNIWGNHEAAVVNEDYERFSSDRGRECAKYTRSILNSVSWDYINHVMTGGGRLEFEVEGQKCLAIHGNMQDEYWKSIKPEEDVAVYPRYDYVFSGHSHHPHFVEKYCEVNNPQTRNKKKIIFINPGSVGQPRNLNPYAQFAILDIETERVIMDKAPYDIAEEQKAYTGAVDDFYRNRLETGV